jgi:putative peptidoglycan lipid II flippase
MEGLRQTLRRGLAAVAFLSIPATVGLIALRIPIVRLLFERGRFDPMDTLHTATALALYSIGLVAYTGVKVLAPAFYAMGTPRVPLLASACAVATNLAIVLMLHGRLGYRAIALGTALGSLFNVMVLIGVFQRRVGGLTTRDLGWSLLKMIVAAGLMGAAALLALQGTESVFGQEGILAQVLTGLVPVAVGGLVYGLAAHLFHVEEARTIGGGLARRLRPRKAPPA